MPLFNLFFKHALLSITLGLLNTKLFFMPLESHFHAILDGHSIELSHEIDRLVAFAHRHGRIHLILLLW